MASESIDLKEVVIDENSQISAENLVLYLMDKRNIHLRSELYTARSGL
jgi:hypothetical protein